MFHILFVVPVFLYVAIQKAATPLPLYYVFLLLAVIILLYHTYKAYIRFQENSPYVWVNMLHILIVVPLLAYIGFKEKDTPRGAYELLALTAFGAFGYHLMRMILYLQVRDQ